MHSIGGPQLRVASSGGRYRLSLKSGASSDCRMTRRLLIVDGDVSCHLACKTRWQDKAKNNVVYIHLDENGNKLPLEFTTEEDERYFDASWNNFENSLKEDMEATWCDSYIMAMKSDLNFRDDLYCDYKLSRKNVQATKLRNLFVPAVRGKAVIEGMAVRAVGREADDLVRIWAEQCMVAGIDFVVCSNDKDLKCIPGKHYNPKKRDGVTYVTEEEGIRHFYEQLLKGDPTDQIPGLPGVGNVYAKKFLAGHSTEEEFQEEVVSRYIDAFGNDWYSTLLINGKLLHIQRTVNDYFCFDNWPVVKELTC